MTEYMIYDFKTGKCDCGWESVREAQDEINSWKNKEEYDLHIVPALIVDIEAEADMLVYPLCGEYDIHFSTVAEFTDEDALNTDLIDCTESNPVVICRMW